MKKEKEFDFDKAYDELLQEAEANGLSENLIFQSSMQEFKRIKFICDELYKGIEEQGVAYKEVGSKGQETYKSNPLTKDYVSAHKQMITTSQTIHKMLANIDTSNGEQDDFPY